MNDYFDSEVVGYPVSSLIPEYHQRQDKINDCFENEASSEQQGAVCRWVPRDVWMRSFCCLPDLLNSLGILCETHDVSALWYGTMQCMCLMHSMLWYSSTLCFIDAHHNVRIISVWYPFCSKPKLLPDY